MYAACWVAMDIVEVILVLIMMATVGDMKKSILYFIMLTLLAACSHRQNDSLHKGEKNLGDKKIEITQIILPADTTSLRGNFELMDSSLMFIDNMYCRIYEFSLEDGNLKNTYGGYGQGPGEMTGIMYGSVIHPMDTSMWILDSSYGVYEFTPSNGNVRFLKRLGFNFEDVRENDFEAVSNYIPMEMSDFSFTINMIGDSVIWIPVSIVNRRIDHDISQKPYKAHIFGLTDPESLKIEGLAGKFPQYYKDNSLRYFDFFDSTVDYPNSRLYVNHAPDSLIYCYDFEGNILSTLGFEPQGVDRGYTPGFDVEPDIFQNDISHVGANTGLYYDQDTGLLFRTTLTDFPSGNVILQAYKENDLVLEQAMPQYFKLLGRSGNSLYGVRFVPLDDGNESSFILYKFEIN